MAVVGKTDDGRDIVTIELPEGVTEGMFADMLYLYAERQTEINRKRNAGMTIEKTEMLWRDLAAIDIAATLVEPMFIGTEND